MALPAKDKRYTAEEYLELERRAEYKSEFVEGEIFALAGATRAHNLVALNCGAELRRQLRGQPCETYPSDMRVQLAASTRYFYPDLVVVCGERDFVDEAQDTLVNPTLITEVLSPSTEGYDRGEKFGQYRTIDSLQSYVLISQHKPLVEVFERQEDGSWRFSAYQGLSSSVLLPSIGYALSLREVYDRIDFGAENL